MKNINWAILCLMLLIFDVNASVMNVAYNSSWPSLNKLINKFEEKVKDKKSQKEIMFSSFEMDSQVASKLVNLQADIAILPIDQYRFVYDYKNSLSRFVIRSIISEVDIGILSKVECGKNYSKLWIDPNLSEYHWFDKNFSSTKPDLVKKNMYSAIYHLDSEKMDCTEAILGSERYLEKLRNKTPVKFVKLGTMPLIILVEDHFMRSRKDQISELISNLASGQTNQDPQKIKQEIIKYNFFDRKNDWRKIDEFIKVD